MARKRIPMSLFEQISTRVSLTDIDCVNAGRGMGVGYRRDALRVVSSRCHPSRGRIAVSNPANETQSAIQTPHDARPCPFSLVCFPCDPLQARACCSLARSLVHSIHVAYITYNALVAGDARPLPSQTQFHSRVRSRITSEPTRPLGLPRSLCLCHPSRRNAPVNNDFGRRATDCGEFEAQGRVRLPGLDRLFGGRSDRLDKHGTMNKEPLQRTSRAEPSRAGLMPEPIIPQSLREDSTVGEGQQGRTGGQGTQEWHLPLSSR
jgi:hypothetical protein